MRGFRSIPGSGPMEKRKHLNAWYVYDTYASGSSAQTADHDALAAYITNVFAWCVHTYATIYTGSSIARTPLRPIQRIDQRFLHTKI